MGSESQVPAVPAAPAALWRCNPVAFDRVMLSVDAAISAEGLGKVILYVGKSLRAFSSGSVSWKIAHPLEAGTVVVLGDGAPEAVEAAVHAFHEAALALSENRAINTGTAADNAMAGLVRGRSVTVLGASGTSTVIAARSDAGPHAQHATTAQETAPARMARKPVIDSVRGHVSTASDRTGYRIDVYSSFGRVRCPLPPGQIPQEFRYLTCDVLVTGYVTRHPQSGRVTSIPEILDITPLPEPAIDGLERAIGRLATTSKPPTKKAKK